MSPRRPFVLPPLGRLALAALLAACGTAGPRAGARGATPAAAADTARAADTSLARADTQPAAPAVLRIDGSPGVLPLAEALAREYEARYPGLRVTLGGGMSTEARVRALAADSIDIAVASHGADADSLAAQGIAVHEVARVAVVFAVHADVPLERLTERQVCDIYEGRTMSWRQLGGPDVPVAPRMRPRRDVDSEVVMAGVSCLKDEHMATTVRDAVRPEDMVRAVTTTPGAIGVASMPFVERSEGRMRALALGSVAPTLDNVRSGAYRLTRRSLFLTRASTPPAVAHFLAYVRSSEGARVIEANGAGAVR
jgi:phosphate transport system substrate-binding protein